MHTVYAHTLPVPGHPIQYTRVSIFLGRIYRPVRDLRLLELYFPD